MNLLISPGYAKLGLHNHKDGDCCPCRGAASTARCCSSATRPGSAGRPRSRRQRRWPAPWRTPSRPRPARKPARQQVEPHVLGTTLAVLRHQHQQTKARARQRHRRHQWTKARARQRHRRHQRTKGPDVTPGPDVAPEACSRPQQWSRPPGWCPLSGGTRATRRWLRERSTPKELKGASVEQF